ncbi:hypothetical protein BDZ89DRAFT_1060364, partial [Hymenopellis radicata]
PYTLRTYDSCDVGTFPNQMLKDHSGPPAALFSDFSRDKYNNELSWLSGQRLSACTYPNSDHPGPLSSSGKYRGIEGRKFVVVKSETVRKRTLDRGRRSLTSPPGKDLLQ